MSVENGIAANIRVFNVSGYHQTDLFVTIVQNGVMGIAILDVSLSNMISFRALLHMSGFDSFCNTVLVTVSLGVSSGDLSTPSSGSKTAGCQVIVNSAKVFLRDRLHGLVAMQRLQPEGDLVLDLATHPGSCHISRRKGGNQRGLRDLAEQACKYDDRNFAP